MTAVDRPAPSPAQPFGVPAGPPDARPPEEWISLIRVFALLTLIPASWQGIIQATRPTVAAGVVLLGAYVIVLALGPGRIPLLRKSDLTIALDLLAVTLVASISGMLNSPFLWLYYLTILEAAARLDMRQAIMASVASAAMILFLWSRGGAAQSSLSGFRIGALIAGGFFLALLLGVLVHDYRSRRERAWWGAQLAQARAQRTAELEAFQDLSARLRGARNADEMYPILVDHAKNLLQADHASLDLLSADHQTLTRICAAGLPLKPVGGTFPLRGAASGPVVETGAAFVTADYASAAEMAGFDPGPAHALAPMAIVPLRSEQEIIGTLGLGRARGVGTRPFTDAEVRLLDGIAEIGGNAIRRARLFQNLEESYMQMVLTLARTMDARDTYTAGHSERIAELAEAVARRIGCSEDDIRDIRWGALLHDIGKIGVPDEILRKPGPLTEAERLVMRQHPVVGESILAPTERMRGVARIVRHHQELWDGSGYPDGLRGEEIPLGARILAIVDAYSAITDDRPYKNAQSHEDAMEELDRGTGARYDPRVADAFAQVVGWTRRAKTHVW